MLKDRDEAWTRVESLAMRHPSYGSKGGVPNNNPFITSQNDNNSPPEEDGENEQITLTAEKIESRATEVSIQNVSVHQLSLFHLLEHIRSWTIGFYIKI